MAGPDPAQASAPDPSTGSTSTWSSFDLEGDQAGSQSSRAQGVQGWHDYPSAIINALGDSLQKLPHQAHLSFKLGFSAHICFMNNFNIYLVIKVCQIASSQPQGTMTLETPGV